VTYTSVLFMRARPGQRDALVAAFRRLGVLETASRQAGFVESAIHLPLDDDDQILVTAAWATADAYDGWLANPERERLAQAVPDLIDEEASAGRMFETVHRVTAT
jgi:quinol monooxygenase YgiN